MSKQPLIRLQGVEKKFGDFVAVRPMDLEIAEGEFVAIMGPSGCGKTTTLRMLAGLDAPTSGEIWMDGQLMNQVPPHKRDTPMVWQSLALFPYLNVTENVAFGLKMRGISRAERKRRSLEWIERLGIGEFAKRNVATLSGGQKQRVALARALVTEPKLLLLDEPLSALDAHLVIRMQSVLTKLQQELGITFVYVTHSQSEAFAMADRVVIMNEGGIAQAGSPRDIYRAPANRFVAEFVGRNNIIAGKVTEVERETASIETKIGTFSAPLTDDLKPGTAATLVVAADQVEIGQSAKRRHNSAKASFVSEEFVGSVVTLFLEGEDGSELKVQAQERALAGLERRAGAPFVLSWPKEAGHLLMDGGG